MGIPLPAALANRAGPLGEVHAGVNFAMMEF
jgi:hypothetical protein